MCLGVFEDYFLNERYEHVQVYLQEEFPGGGWRENDWKSIVLEKVRGHGIQRTCRGTSLRKDTRRPRWMAKIFSS